MSALAANEMDTLVSLLERLASAGEGTPRLPGPVFRALRGICTQPTAEVFVRDEKGGVLLTPRRDGDFEGWHLPGGFVGCEEPLEVACDRIARAELGAGAKLVGIAAHYTWPSHPYASALSLLCACELEGEPNDGRYFASLPDECLPEHRALIERAVSTEGPR